MGGIIKKDNTSRMELRLSSADKELFEYAKYLSGAPTLAEFVRRVVREKAGAIVDEYEKMLTSKKDQEIFFNALMNPPAPGKSLKEAIAFYNSEVVE